jgi:lysophospholipase L1-like esterase
LTKNVVTDENGFRVLKYRKKISGKTFRILCLGDSSTFGWGLDYKKIYPFLLEKELEKSFDKVRVYNAGVPGYTSFQTSKQLEKIVERMQFDLVIAYVSNNETSFTGNSDRSKHDEYKNWIGIRELLNRFRFYQFLKEIILRPKPFNLIGNIPLEQLMRSPPRVSPEEFRQNLKNIISHTKQKSTRMILATVPVNYSHSDFLEIPHKSPAINSLIASVSKKIDSKDYWKALAQLNKGEFDAPDYYKIKFLRGKVLKILGDEHYLREFDSAIELHPFPDRLKNSYNQMIIDTANEYQVPLVDLRMAFRDSDHGNDNLFFDAAHPNEKGHQIIADMLSRNIIENFKN